LIYDQHKHNNLLLKPNLKNQQQSSFTNGSKEILVLHSKQLPSGFYFAKRELAALTVFFSFYITWEKRVLKVSGRKT